MLKPIKGNPGRFLDTSTGQVLNIAEYREDDKYDSVFLPGEGTEITFGTQYIFFRDITSKQKIDCNFTQQSRLSAGEEMVVDRIGLYPRHTIAGSGSLLAGADADIIRIAEDGFFRVEVNSILLSEGPAFKYASGYGINGQPDPTGTNNTIGIGVASTAAAAKLVKTQVLSNKYEVIGYLTFYDRSWILDEPSFPEKGEIGPLSFVSSPGIIVTAFLHGLIKSAVNK